MRPFQVLAACQIHMTPAAATSSPRCWALADVPTATHGAYPASATDTTRATRRLLRRDRPLDGRRRPLALPDGLRPPSRAVAPGPGRRRAPPPPPGRPQARRRRRAPCGLE